VRRSVRVAIVGGGPAGLAAAEELGRRGVDGVVVLERELEAGGVPRHAVHQGFGLRDLHRSLSGPRYAERRRGLAEGANARIECGTAVTGWSADGALELTSPSGREALEAGAVLLATGCRERPRAARLIAGARPAGVMTTGTLQQLVYLHGGRPGRRAVIVGAEHVSFSALATLAHGGAEAVAMLTELPRHQSFAAFRIGAALRYRVPLLTSTTVVAIEGRERVEAVRVRDLDGGGERLLPCDLVVLTANWVPEAELARTGGTEIDAGTQGPAVDASLRTSREGVFAAGNLTGAAETADLAALSGRHAAAAIAAYLQRRSWPAARVPIEYQAPVLWAVPNRVATDAGQPLHRRISMRGGEFQRLRRARVEQGGVTLWSGVLPRIVPGRPARIRAGWLPGVELEQGPLRVGLD
jgi:thioredoxin reductase